MILCLTLIAYCLKLKLTFLSVVLWYDFQQGSNDELQRIGLRSGSSFADLAIFQATFFVYCQFRK